MINPHLYVPLGKRINTPAGKHYRARLFRHGALEEILLRPTFKTATAAMLYAQKAHGRMCRQYDAEIVRLAKEADEESAKKADAEKEPEHAA